MSLDTIIRRRMQEKELRLAGDLVMTKIEWQQRGGIYRGSLGKAAEHGYYTIRDCENMGRPVTADELNQVKDFAMCKMFYSDYLIKKNGKNFVPCVPVFFRVRREQCFYCKRYFFVDDPEFDSERHICSCCSEELEKDNPFTPLTKRH